MLQFSGKEIQIQLIFFFKVERENLIGVLQNKPGPFSVIPQSPRTGSVHSAGYSKINLDRNYLDKIKIF